MKTKEMKLQEANDRLRQEVREQKQENLRLRNKLSRSQRKNTDLKVTLASELKKKCLFP
jgi:hypothetical protein